MSTSKDGGPAFPTDPTSSTPIAQCEGDKTKWIHTYHGSQPGMSLRDWFAGQIIAACVAGAINKNPKISMSECASDAYQQADAMLAARSATQTRENKS